MAAVTCFDVPAESTHQYADAGATSFIAKEYCVVELSQIILAVLANFCASVPEPPLAVTAATRAFVITESAHIVPVVAAHVAWAVP